MMPSAAKHMDAMRTRNNHSMTLDVDAEITKTSFGYMGKQQLKGMYSTKNRSIYEPGTDIKRNASVAVVDYKYAPKLFNSSRKNLGTLDGLGSTVGGDSQRGGAPKMFVEGISKSPSNAVVGSHT